MSWFSGPTPPPPQPTKKKKMVKFDVTPQLTLSGKNDVSAAALVRFNHNDNRVTVRLTDAQLKDQSLNGLSVGVKNDRLELVYDVANHAPRVTLNSHLNVRDKRVNLTYERDIKGNASSVKSSVAVDDSNTATLVYDLTGYDKPSHKACTLKWTHVNGDISVTPAYNLGTESLSLDATYTVDSENSLRAKYDMNSNMGELAWTNSSGAGGGGDVKITARANLADANSAKQMPVLLLEKSWTIDN